METVTYETYSTNIHPVFGSIISLIYIIIFILFLYSVYKCITKIPTEKRIFPAWFAWLCLIPIAGYVFMWLTLPFAVGKALQNSDDTWLQEKGRRLFGLGLALVILPLFTFIPLVNIFIGIAELIIFIIYWSNTAQINKRIL